MATRAPAALIRRITRWPVPAAAGGAVAAVLGSVGLVEAALAAAFAGSTVSAVLAGVELRQARASIDDLREHLQHAMNHGGYRDAETGLGTIAALRIDWARQVARLQRRGERFSLAVFEINEGQQAPAAPALRAAGDLLRSIARSEDTLYRLAPARVAVLLPGSDPPGAAAFIERARAALSPLVVPGSAEPVEISIETDVVDWREGVDAFPEARIAWASEAGLADERIFRRFSRQRGTDRPEQLPEAA